MRPAAGRLHAVARKERYYSCHLVQLNRDDNYTWPEIDGYGGFGRHEPRSDRERQGARAVRQRVSRRAESQRDGRATLRHDHAAGEPDLESHRLDSVEHRTGDASTAAGLPARAA